MFSRLLIYFLRKPQVVAVIKEIAQPSTPNLEQDLKISASEFETLLARILAQRERRHY